MEDKDFYIIKMYYGSWDDFVDHELGMCVGAERTQKVLDELRKGNFQSIRPIFDQKGDRTYKKIYNELMSIVCWDESSPNPEQEANERFKQNFPDLYDDYMKDDLDEDREREIDDEIEFRTFKKYYPDLTKEVFIDQRYKQRLYDKIQEHWQEDCFGVYSQKLFEIVP